MRCQWIIFLAFVTSGFEALCQFRDRASSQLQLSGVGFLGGTNYVTRMSDNCGIYSSEGDRRAGRLSLAIDCKSEEHKISSGFVREKSAIKIVREEETHSFLKRDIYGYRDCSGKEYHFFQGNSFELVNPGEAIPIYRTYRQRGKQRVTKYFFASMTGEIRPLTLEDLRIAFAEKPQFLEKLAILAENNFQLTRYLYLINRVWGNSMENI